MVLAEGFLIPMLAVMRSIQIDYYDFLLLWIVYRYRNILKQLTRVHNVNINTDLTNNRQQRTCNERLQATENLLLATRVSVGRVQSILFLIV